MKYIATDHPKFVKDPKSGALLSIDGAGRKAYEAKKKKFNEINEMDNRINKLEKKMDDMLDLLRQIVESK